MLRRVNYLLYRNKALTNFMTMVLYNPTKPTKAFNFILKYKAKHNIALPSAKKVGSGAVKVNLHSIRFSYVFVRFFTFLLLLEKVCAFSSAFL